jgi:hypothetical protein
MRRCLDLERRPDNLNITLRERLIRFMNPLPLKILVGAFLLHGPVQMLTALAGDETVRVGAIRWDAWYGDDGPVEHVEHSLG